MFKSFLLNRRQFLKVAGITTGAVVAGSGTAFARTLPGRRPTLARTADRAVLVTAPANTMHTACNMCSNFCAASAIRETVAGTTLVRRAEGRAGHPNTRGGLCAKGQAAVQLLYDPDRLKTPLRKRAADIPLLVAHFLEKFGAGARTISPRAMEALVNYQWPGNVRELENTIERVVILSHGDTIQAEDLPAEVRANVNVCDAGSRCFLLPEGGLDLEEVELDLVRQALERSGGSVPQAAKLLGLTSKTLEARMERYGL